MKKEQKKMNNKGFSLVELIIVMAIMAILVGVVGTQVIPYLNNAKESKDLQIISEYGTAAVSAYAQNADKMTSSTPTTKTFTVYGSAETDPFYKAVQEQIKTLTYSTGGTGGLQDAMKSTEGKKIDDIQVKVDSSSITVQGITSSDSSTHLSSVTSELSH
jgi:type IV pilus assembly protein PilA